MARSIMDIVKAAMEEVRGVSPQEAAALMDKGALVVDVRDPPELQTGGKVMGAVKASRGMLAFRAEPKSPYHNPVFDPGKTVILNCASGGRSALAGKALRDLGYDDVRNLGAFKDWVESCGAVEPA